MKTTSVLDGGRRKFIRRRPLRVPKYNIPVLIVLLLLLGLVQIPFWATKHGEIVSLERKKDDHPKDLNQPDDWRASIKSTGPTTQQLTSPLQKDPNNPNCSHWRGMIRPEEVTRHLLPSPPPTGIVVTLVLGQGALESLCRFFPSQWEKLIIPQQWDLLLVVGRTFKDKPTVSKKRKRDLVSCLKLQQVPGPTKHWNNLDGTTLMAEQYQVDLFNVTTYPHINKIWVAETEVKLPRFIEENQALLKVPMQPRQCQAPIPYVLGTKWYVHEMLHLSILQEYDYFIKLDTDVVFLEPLPRHLLHDMTIRRAVFGHTGQYPNHIVAPCGTGITKAVQEFLQQQRLAYQLPCSQGHPALAKDAGDLYYTNFVVGRTDFFRSPSVLEFSRFLAEYREGYFRYRWTDQIFWHFAMGLFVGGGRKDGRVSSFEGAVVDYTEFRCAPRKNCWLSVHHFDHDRCENGGVFFHTKAKHAPGNSKWKWGEEFSNNTKLEPMPRGSLPFQTTYEDQCKQMGF